MRLVMFARISRCPENRSSYLPFEENHAQTKCANLTTETVFKLLNLYSIGNVNCVTLNAQTLRCTQIYTV